MQAYIVRINKKGQITIPAERRVKLGIHKGCKVKLVLENNEISITLIKDKIPVLDEASDIFNLIGAFDGPPDLSFNHDFYLIE